MKLLEITDLIRLVRHVGILMDFDYAQSSCDEKGELVGRTTVTICSS